MDRQRSLCLHKPDNKLSLVSPRHTASPHRHGISPALTLTCVTARLSGVQGDDKFKFGRCFCRFALRSAAARACLGVRATSDYAAAVPRSNMMSIRRGVRSL
jgi:hypothetical protein